MKMFKKGISPLIATVLIIGFTVALAAIIMTWGTTFSKGMQKSTEATTEEQMSCAQDVMIDLSAACVQDDPSGCYADDSTGCKIVKLTVKNDGNKEILRTSARFYKDASTVATNKSILALPLDAYGIRTINVTLTDDLEDTADGVTLVEIIPVIKVGEKELTCAQTKDYYGDQSYGDPLIKCA